MVKPVWNNTQRVNHQNFAKKTHPYAKKNLVLRAILMKSGLVSINTARQNISKTAVSVNTARQVNTAHSKTIVNAARPMSYLSKIAHSTVKRPIHKNTAFKNSNIDQRVNTVSSKKINIARPKAVVNVVKGNNVNAVKASTCWVWKPKTKVLDNVSKHNRQSINDLQDQGIDGGYIAFGGNPKGGKIIGKAKKSVRLMMEKLFGIELEAKTINEEQQLHALVDGKKVIITESTVRRYLQLEDEEGVDCLPNATIFEQLALMSTMASAIICLATNQKFNFSKFIFESMIRNLENVSDKAVYKELGDSLVRAATTASSLEAEQDSGGGPRRQETIGDTIAQTRFEYVSKHSNDSLLARGNTLRSDEDRLKLNELMELYEDITLVSVQDDANKEMFYVDTLNVSTTATTVIITTEEITLAQALEALKTSKPKVKGIVLQEPEPDKPLKKKDQLKLDEEITLKLQAEIDEEEKIARAEEEKIDEANIAWNDIQAKVDADY
ncbi:hypothetical protein Tco_0531962 [Tanacetum coccineum]